MSLYDSLTQHHKDDIYPYHMPGHKRKSLTQTLMRVGDLDITEIDGFDNLNHPEGLLLDVQRKAADIYGADESFYLVGGSTLGILSAISAVTGMGDTILIGRNCHKSVYHAAYLRQLRLEYVYPEYDSHWEVFAQTHARDIREKLIEHPEIKAVVVVSPTYEGFYSNINEIADVVHSFGKILIVDEAHGAHLGFHPAWPDSAIKLGADVVIQSLHKTLPAMTQTALLHVKGERVDRERLKRFLYTYQTSSPSYVFMSSMEEAISFMEEQGKQAMEKFKQLWIKMLQRLSGCEFIEICRTAGDSEGNVQAHDIGKLMISASKAGVDGQTLHQVLLQRFALQMEMAQGKYVLAMFTVADEADAYDRLIDALLTLEEEYKSQKDTKVCDTKANGMKIPRLQSEMMLYEAWDEESEWVSLEEVTGRCAAEFILLYPPGVPLVVPGEIINQNLVSIIKENCVLELPIQGVKAQGDTYQVKVLKHK